MTKNKKGHWRRRPSNGNGKVKMIKEVNGTINNILHQEPANFKLVNLEPPSDYWLFCNLWASPDKPELIFIRTGRPRKPIGGQVGAVIVCDRSTGQIAARHADWPEWSQIRDEFKLHRLKGNLAIEIKVKALQAAMEKEKALVD